MDKTPRIVGYWLLLGAFLVLTMVVIGGITRLTHSGLSMVTWKPISGVIPPMNDAEWDAEFDNYKTSPEFEKVHSHFTVEEFKSIFFWEYLHRLLGRLLGVVFLIPFLWFLYKKKLQDKNLKRHLVVIFLLGALQGLIGWFMVKSGLSDRPEVSHYRLAIHLCAALFLACYIFWAALWVFYPNSDERTSQPAIRKWLWIVLGVVFVQIVYGAFVAGLKAGLLYPTYPMMGDGFLATEGKQSFSDNGIISLFEDRALVQFIHRWIAVLVVASVGVVFFKARKMMLSVMQNKLVYFLVGMVVVQFLLGVFTLLFSVPVSLGVIHQLGAVFLLLGIIQSLYFFRS